MAPCARGARQLTLQARQVDRQGVFERGGVAGSRFSAGGFLPWQALPGVVEGRRMGAGGDRCFKARVALVQHWEGGRPAGSASASASMSSGTRRQDTVHRCIREGRLTSRHGGTAPWGWVAGLPAHTPLPILLPAAQHRQKIAAINCRLPSTVSLPAPALLLLSCSVSGAWR